MGPGKAVRLLFLARGTSRADPLEIFEPAPVLEPGEILLGPRGFSGVNPFNIFDPARVVKPERFLRTRTNRAWCPCKKARAARLLPFHRPGPKTRKASGRRPERAVYKIGVAR